MNQQERDKLRCLFCGKLMAGRRKAGKYCDWRCRFRDRYIPAAVRRQSKKCAFCAKAFIPENSSRQKYCGAECRWRSQKEKWLMILRKRSAARLRRLIQCRGCGEVFQRRISFQRYCSDACYNKMYLAREAAKRNTYRRACAQCAAEFETRRPNQRHCSTACSDRSHWTKSNRRSSKKRALKRQGKRCQRCGDEIHRKQSNARFCTPRCAGLHNAKTHCDGLSDRYVRIRLRQLAPLGTTDIPPEIVELKRTHLRALRLLGKTRNKNT